MTVCPPRTKKEASSVEWLARAGARPSIAQLEADKNLPACSNPPELPQRPLKFGWKQRKKQETAKVSRVLSKVVGILREIDVERSDQPLLLPYHT